jgi:tight adherence protein C
VPLPLLLVAAVALGGLVALGLALDRRAARRRQVAARLARLCGGEAAQAAGEAPLGRALGVAADLVRPALSTLTAGLFARESDRDEMRALLASAGWRDHGALGALALAKFAGLALGGGAAALATLGAGLWPELPLLRVGAIAGGAVAGAILPEIAVRMRRDARREAMRAALPDAIDLMVIAAYAGQSLDMALDRVSRELGPFAPALADELGVATAELQVLPDRAEALRRLEARTGLREVKSFVLTLVQTIRYGAPFAESLKALGGDLRQARMIAAEERGAKLPALLTLPLILFIMPAVFVVVIGPAILSMSAIFGS